MTSRFGKRNRSSSKLEQSGGYSSSSAGDQSKRIKDLEKSLEEKDKTIAGLEEKIKELSSELERRKHLTDVLTSDRNALRQKNASLVGKLAELSRKQSVSSFTTLPSPPELPKRYPAISTRPDLPPTPASPETPFEDPDQKEPGAHTPRFNFGSPPHTLQHQQQPPNGHIGQNSPPQSNHVLATTKGDESETDYSDMEDDLEAVSPVVDTMTTAQPSTDSQSTSNGRVAQLQSAGDDDKSDFVNSGLVRESEIDSVLAAVQETVRKTNFAMANSERKESPGLSQRGRRKEGEREEEERVGGSGKEESLKAKAMVDSTSQEETGERGNVRLHKRPSVEALAAQFERVSSTSTALIPTSSLKWRSQNHQGSPHSPSTLSDVSPSELTFSETPTVASKPRSSSLRGNSSSDTPLSTSHNRTPSVRSAGSGSSPEPRRFNSGSEGIASRIASLFSSNRKGSKDKGSPSLPPPPPTSGEAKSMTMMNGGGSLECQNGGSAVQSMDTPLANETPLTNETPTTDDGNAPKGASESESPSTMKRFKQDSVASNMGSDLISSGDYSTTDIDSSFDLTSPPTSPASSLGASSLASASISLPANKRLEGIEARNALLSKKRFENRNLKKSPRIPRVRLQERGAGEDEEGEEEECDTLGDLVSMDPRQKMRERTKTVSMTQGVSSRTTTELGRQKRTKKEIREKQFALKRHHSLTDLRLLAGTFALKELELISPDFESKIREKIVKSVGEKYGGLEKATQAAIKIQQSWRQFKLRSRFQKIKQQNKSQLQLQMRKRAQSMRDPRRRPSIMKKRGKRAYLREASVAGLPSVEQKLKTSTSGLVHGVGHSKTNVKVPPTVKIGEQLTEQEEETEGERKKVVEIMEVSTDTMLEGGNTTTVSIQPPKLQLNDSSVQVSDAPGPTAAVAVQITDSSPTPSHNNVQSDSPDGLTASLTTADLRSSPRPLSVFSTGSSVSLSGSYQEGLMVQSLTMNSVTLPRLRSRPRDQDPLGRDRALSVGSAIFNRRRAIGINHFNRKPTKGIQYLVESQVLDDDPKSVADFLTDGKNKLCKQKIGEFVGEINSDFNMAVLGCLLEQMDMSGKPIDKALRELQQLFRMPGEAQKIDKIMEIFALEYFKHNKENGSVKSEDAAYILSFAIMMLHTALHNPSVKHKTTKREWVSMNRGCNDGENFYENFLLDIYDRIQSTEFVCGKDHTQEVAEIEKQIITVANLPKLATSQRHLVLKLNVSEVLDLSRGPNFRQRHRRTLFIFNDLLIVCKQRRHEQYQCRNFFPLLHVLPVKFETEHYRNGIQLLSSIERKVLLQCTCDSLGERKTLLEKLEETIKELEEMEQERIEELGSSLSAKPGQDVHIGGSMRHSSASRSHGRSTADLQVSSSFGKLASSSLTDLREESYEEDTQIRPSSCVQVRNNRASGDSGFDSPQQDADTPISTPTPSPTEQNHIDASDSQTPSPSPSPSPALLPPPTSPHQNSHTMPHGAITHSRSHDGLRTLTVYPNTPERSPSAELVRPSPTSSPSPSPSHKKAQKKEKKQRSHYVNINIFSRSKGKESKSGGSGKGGSSSPGASPMHNRKRRASDSAQAVHSVGVRETSPSNLHTPLAQSLNLNAKFGTGNLSDSEGQSYP